MCACTRTCVFWIFHRLCVLIAGSGVVKASASSNGLFLVVLDDKVGGGIKTNSYIKPSRAWLFKRQLMLIHD